MSLFGLLVELVQIKRTVSFIRLRDFSISFLLGQKNLPFLHAHELLIHFLLKKSIHTKKCSKTFGAKKFCMEEKRLSQKLSLLAIEMNTILLLSRSVLPT